MSDKWLKNNWNTDQSAKSNSSSSLTIQMHWTVQTVLGINSPKLILVGKSYTVIKSKGVYRLWRRNNMNIFSCPWKWELHNHETQAANIKLNLCLFCSDTWKCHGNQSKGCISCHVALWINKSDWQKDFLDLRFSVNGDKNMRVWQKVRGLLLLLGRMKCSRTAKLSPDLKGKL